MDLKHSIDMTASAETVLHVSKSTDFIKPKDSSTNFEAQNPGTFHSYCIRGWIDWASRYQFNDFVCVFFLLFFSMKTGDFKVYARRWLVLAIFTLYSASNALQWIQYSIIANVIERWVKNSIFSAQTNKWHKLITGCDARTTSGERKK